MANKKQYLNGHLKMDPYIKKRINRLYDEDPKAFRELLGIRPRQKKAKGGLIQGFPKLATRGF